MINNFFEKASLKNWKPIGRPNNIFDSDCDWPYSILDFNFEFEKMLEEIKSLQKFYFVKHREKDKINSYGHEGWNALTLHGIDATKTEHFDRYGFKTEEDADYKWTDVCEYLPTITQFVKSLNYQKYGRVRIMKLESGGYIMPHTDGEGRIFGPFNIAINNPDGCKFAFEKDGIVPFQPARGAFLDLGRRHAVWNNSNEDRYHLIIHGIINNELIVKSIEQTLNFYG